MTGLDLIAAERKRQIEEEGYSPQNDSKYTFNQLSRAGASYALPEQDRLYHNGSKSPVTWPFGPEWWKPSPGDRKRELVKAGALIAAELDRMLEAEKKAQEK